MYIEAVQRDAENPGQIPFKSGVFSNRTLIKIAANGDFADFWCQRLP